MLGFVTEEAATIQVLVNIYADINCQRDIVLLQDLVLISAFHFSQLLCMKIWVY